MQVLVGVKVAHNDGSVFATCNPELLETCEKLVARGWILETTTIYISPAPDSKDRCFQLTIKGKEETGFLQVSDVEYKRM